MGRFRIVRSLGIDRFWVNGDLQRCTPAAKSPGRSEFLRILVETARPRGPRPRKRLQKAPKRTVI
eukprot:1724649-Pyramimonas_sp.AAC.1